LLWFLGANFIHDGLAYHILEGVADLRSDVLAIILSLLFTDLPWYIITLVHVDGVTDLFWNTLALLLRDLGTLPVSDNVAVLPGHVVHHSLLDCVTVLHGVHHRHLNSIADSLGHAGALLVVHGFTLGPGHHVLLSLVLGVADIVKLGLTHGDSLVMTDRLGDCLALGLVFRVTLRGCVDGFRGVATLLDHSVGTDIPGDSVALGGGGLAYVGSVEDVNKEQGHHENLHF